MAVQYNKLFKLLIDKKMSNVMLVERANISANIITRLKKDQYISLDSIEKICRVLLMYFRFYENTRIKSSRTRRGLRKDELV